MVPDPIRSLYARVAELVDARDLKSLGGFLRAGSSPASGTTALRRHSQVAKAGACKALIPGSNPGGASTLHSLLWGGGRAG